MSSGDQQKMSLFHYTDAHGLMGIVKNQGLWATDVRFLNDSMEMHAGLQLVYRRCHELRDQVRNRPEHEVRLTEELYGILPAFMRKNLEQRNVYIVSFSEARDNLRQWMAYCPKNAGYAIEFAHEALLVDGSFEEKKGVVCRLEKVDYDEQEIDSIISPEAIINQIRKSNYNVQDATLITVNKLIFHICAVKAPAFYDERETRLIIQSKATKEHPVEFRSRAGLIIPYFDYPAPRSLIREITIGPNVNMELARQGLENFLDAHSVKCSIQESNCSLRVF